MNKIAKKNNKQKTIENCVRIQNNSYPKAITILILFKI